MLYLLLDLLELLCTGRELLPPLKEHLLVARPLRRRRRLRVGGPLSGCRKRLFQTSHARSRIIGSRL